MEPQMNYSFIVVCLFLMLSPSGAQIEGLYCGKENCYDLLGIQRDAGRDEIGKAYRTLAKKWHPDKHRGEEEKEKASQIFQRIANAYEILKDEDSRKDYDYMLDHPDEYYSHYFYYYRRRVAPQVDVRLVIAVTVTIISVIQYWSAWNNYNQAISYLVTIPKYRLQAQQIARSEGLLQDGSRKKKDKHKSKEELREEEETILKQVLQNKMDIRGGYSKPSILDMLWLQLILLPYYSVKYVWWNLWWIWQFSIMRKEYGEEEKTHIIRSNMKLKQAQWDSLEDHDKESFLHKQLWIPEKFQEWKKFKEEEAKTDLAGNARYKMYRRYMKKGGPGQMTFGPD